VPPPQFIGRFEIIGSIGSGGMGSLWRARDPKIGGRILAIKVLKEGLDNEEIRRRFMQEANAAGVLEHENIVRIFDVGEHNGEPFIAMEYIDGETLSAWIRRREPATIARRLKLIEELCDGLAYAHTFGIIHRDVKPANLMVERRRGRLKILDFGIAKLADSGITNAGALIGSFNYMSPEQVRGFQIDHRSDIFSVGAVLFELLSYRQAFPGGLGDGVLGRIAEQPAPLLRQAMEHADHEIEQIIARALQKDANRRFQDLTEMHRELTRARRRLERDDSDEHTLIDRPSARKPEPTPPPQTPRSTPAGGVADQEAQFVAIARAKQLAAYVAAAERALASGDYDGAIQQSYQASALDESDSRARDVRERAKNALNLQQVHQWMVEARAALSRHDLESAEGLVARARELKPDAPEIDEVQQSVVRVRNHTAALAAVERARRSLERREWTNAIRETNEADRFEPGLDEARSIRRHAQAGLDEQRRIEAHEQAARQVIGEARQQFSQHKYQGALDHLAAFAPPHAAVSRELDRLRAELAAIQEQEAIARQRAERARQAIESARQALVSGAWDEARAAADEAAREGADPSVVGRLVQQIESGRSRAVALARLRAQAQAIFADAHQKFEAGDFRAALARCDQALQLIPNEAAILDLRERAQRAIENEEERARREAHDRAASQVLDQAGREFAAGRHNDAIARLTEFHPPHPRVTAAVEELRSAHAAIEAKAAEAIARAQQMFGEGQHDAALDELARFEPAGLQSVTNALAALRVERRRLEDAALEARRLEEQRRAEEEARRALAERVAALVASARALADAQRFDEALAAIAEASGLDSANAEVAQLGRSVRAAKAEHDAAARKARDLATKLGDAEARLANGDFARALKRIDEVLTVEPGHAEAQALRATVLARQEEKRQADEADRLRIEEARKARERASQVAALLKKARRARKPEPAIELLQQALAIDPGHAEAQALLEQRQAERQARSPQPAIEGRDQYGEIRPIVGTDAEEVGEAIPKPQARKPVPAGVLAAAALVVVALAAGLTLYLTREGPPKPTPPVRRMAFVTIDSSPWTNVTITPEGAPPREPKKCTTPCGIQLAEGRYQVTFEPNGASKPESQSIHVKPDQENKVHRTMSGFDVDRAVDSILGPESQQ
jgi:serine/threonine protein kinase/tetratricopeptide (TPR) repeat protein